MLKEKILIFLFSILVSHSMRRSSANNLPTAVALGGAIVAAVEEDEAQEQLKLKAQRDVDGVNFSYILNLLGLKAFYTEAEIADARGKYEKKHKLMKHLYPLLIGAVLAKTVVVPLVLKLLTALSASSFIMAKIALAASALLALKWIFADSVKEHTRFEIVHLPLKGSSGGGLGHSNLDWNDLSWSGSSYVDTKVPQKPRFKYIPLGGGGDGLQNTFSGNKAFAGASPYRYSTGSNLDGKPFL